MNRIAPILGLLLLSSALPGAVPQLVRGTKELVRLLPERYDARRAIALGAFWPSVEEVRRSFPGDARIPIVLRRPRDIDRAVFLNYYLYPRGVDYVWGADAWRVTPGFDPAKPVVWFDLSRTEAARVMKWPEVRSELLREASGETPLPGPLAAQRFVIPLAVAVDGSPPDAYATEAIFVSGETGELSLVFEPQGKAVRFPLDARRPLVFRDLVHEAFGELGTGWVRASATVPVRAEAWLVNWPRGKRAGLQLTVSSRLPQEFDAGDSLWLVNTGDASALVRAGSEDVELAPRALRRLAMQGPVRIEGDGAVIAFASRKLSDGNSDFFWPREQP